MAVEIIRGHCLTELAKLPDASVQCCVTSPPYWALRDYKTPPVVWPALKYRPMAALPEIRVKKWKGELGLEPDPFAFVGHIVAVFREVRRVLKEDGTCWVNFGDCSATGAGKGNNGRQHLGGRSEFVKGPHPDAAPNRMPMEGLGPKNLMGMPWRVAFALQADGWTLRSDIIWHKPNPTPESAGDRPTKAHEYIFLFSKSRYYYYDAEAIMENVTGNAHSRGKGTNPKAQGREAPTAWDTGPGNHDDKKVRYRPTCGPNSRIHKDRDPAHDRDSAIDAKQNRSFSAAVSGLVERRNKRSVWTVTTYGYRGAHFATFPPDLIRPCIRAGSKEGDTIIDPFGGSGTTGAVATEYNRNAILIELAPDHIPLCRQRVGSETPSFPGLG